MNKNEMKNRISIALKDPILQQGFEIICKENEELKEINEGYCRSRDRLISMGFPTFKDCKEYAEHLTKAKEIIRGLLELGSIGDGDYTYVAEAEQFLKEMHQNDR